MDASIIDSFRCDAGTPYVMAEISIKNPERLIIKLNIKEEGIYTARISFYDYAEGSYKSCLSFCGNDNYICGHSEFRFYPEDVKGLRESL